MLINFEFEFKPKEIKSQLPKNIRTEGAQTFAFNKLLVCGVRSRMCVFGTFFKSVKICVSNLTSQIGP